jgi:uncharacterized lipoprotein YmbA
MNKNVSYYLQRVAFVLFSLLVAGCGTSPTPNFFHLEKNADVTLTGIERGTAIGVGPVNIAQYLDRPQIVTRAGSHRLLMSEFNRWSEPLKNSISRVISVSLSTQLQTTRVYLMPRRNKSIPLDYQVAIDIARFDGELGSDARLVARWSLYDTDNKVILTKVSIISVASEGTDFESLVAAENRALQSLSTEIAEAIKFENNRAPM